jgi:hypothetical protein
MFVSLGIGASKNDNGKPSSLVVFAKQWFGLKSNFYKQK